MTPATSELLRRASRLALTLIGVLFILIFIRPTKRRGGGAGGLFGEPFLPDGVVFGIGVLAALAIALGAGAYCLVRVRSPVRPGASFWRTERALFLSCVLYLVGAGLFCAWVTEWDGDDEGGLAFFVTAFAIVAAVSATERGRLPAIALLLGSLLASIAALVRLGMGTRWRSYADEVFAFGILSLFLLPLSYLLVRGLLNLVGGRSAPQSPGSGFGLPVQVLAQQGAYLVSVEAPGLTEVVGVETSVFGSQLRLVIPRPASNQGTLVYSTRFSGRFPVVVDLPQPLQDPWDVKVANGLVTVQVAPLGDD